MGQQGLRVAQQQAHHRAGAVEFLHQDPHRQAIAEAGGLDHGPARRAAAAHEERHAQHALVPYPGNFGRAAIFQQVVKRNDGRRREDDIVEFAAGFAQHVAEPQRYRFKVRRKAVELGVEQGSEKVVLVGVLRT